MVRALAVPDRAVAGGFDRLRGKRRVAGLDLLQAGDVGLRLVEPSSRRGSRPLTPLTLKVAIVRLAATALAALPLLRKNGTR